MTTLRTSGDDLTAVRRMLSDDPRDRPTLEERYDAGDELIKAMINGTGTINALHLAFMIEQDFNKVTNIWADAEIRSFWDETQKWVTAGGTAFAAAGLLVADSTNDRLRIAGWSLASVAAVRAVGNFLGPEGRERLQQKIDFIGYSRAAFDDLRIRSDLNNAFKKRNEDFITTMRQFDADRYDKATTNAQRAEVIAELMAYLSQFDESLGQVPEVIEMQERMQTRYNGLRDRLDPDIAATLTTLGDRLQEAKQTYKDYVIPTISLSAELRRKLMGL
jgi:hypothetical protein